MDGIVAHARHRRRDIDEGKVLAIAEATATDTLQSFGQTNVAQSSAVVEGFVANALHSVGDVDGLQGVAAVENIVANAGECRWQLDVAQPVAFAEHVGCHRGQACLGQRHIHQLCIMSEVAVTTESQVWHVLGESDGAQRVTSPEGSVAEVLDGRWQGHFLQPVAFPEGVPADGLQTLVEGERGHHGVAERFLTYRLHRRWQGEGSKAFGVVEGVWFNHLQVLREGHVLQLLAGVAGRTWYRGEVFGEHHCLQFVAVLEDRLSPGRETLREGEADQLVAFPESVLTDARHRLGYHHGSL